MNDKPIIDSDRMDQVLVSVNEFKILKDKTGNLNVFTNESVDNKTFIPYKIEGKVIEQVYLPQDHELIIFHTTNSIIAVDYQNNIIDDPQWIDYYVEPISKQLFRKVNDDQWYDIQGFLLHPPVFIFEDILISLPTKSSKKSISFKNEKLTTNPDNSLIQIGKLVFSASLKLLTYHGEKVTAIGNKQIKLHNTIVQEVGIGKYKKAFIDLTTYEPYIIKGHKINTHLNSAKIGNYDLELFASGEKQFVINIKDNQLLTIDEEPLSLEFEDYLLFDNYELINGSLDSREVVYDLKTHTLFSLSQLIPNEVTKIQTTVISIQDDKLINIHAGQQKFVYSIIRHAIFKLNNGDITPQRIETIDQYEDYFARAVIDDKSKIFYLDTCCLLAFDNKTTEIRSILDTERNKLINAIDSHHEPVVLDARSGYQQLSLAAVNDHQIRSVKGSPYSFGVAIIQNAAINSTGGQINRVIRIDKTDIGLFTVDPDIRSFLDGDQPSVFAGNPIVSVDLENSIYLGKEAFMKIVFIPFHEIPTQAYVNQKTGKVLVIEGEANRHEIVTEIPERPQVLHLGEYELVQVKTLTDDFQDMQILMCQKTKKSSLSFHDNYLPKLEKHFTSDSKSTWEYQLFKIRTNNEESKYLVAENHPPYRILVEETKNRIAPKLIPSNDQVLIEPKKRSRFAKLFLHDPGFLR